MYASIDVQNFFLSSPLEVRKHIVVTISVQCMCEPALCVWCACVHWSGFVRAIILHLCMDLKKKLANLFFQRSSSAIQNICSGSLEVKVTPEGQRIKW